MISTVSFKSNIIRTVLLTCLTLTFTQYVLAEDNPSKLSGIVVSADGKTISEIQVELSYVEIDEIKGGTIDLSSGHTAETDQNGKFSFTEIDPGLVQLRVHNKNEAHDGVFLWTSSRVSVVQIGKLKFYPHFSGFRHLGKVTFSIKPGKEIRNLIVVLEKRLIIHGRIEFKDGSPLGKAQLDLEFNWLRLAKTGNFVSKNSRTLSTNQDGRFYHWVSRPGVCTITLKHNGLSAYSEPFFLDRDMLTDNIVLTLDGNANDMTTPLPEKPKEEEQYRPSYIPDYPAMWIMNPSNKHLYKWIHCNGREDALKKAAEEDAYLVTITTEAEQIWLESAFGKAPYWIGLTDEKREGKWEWENGEPVTYTNWKPKEFDPMQDNGGPGILRAFGVKGEDQKRQEDEEDYVYLTGQWTYWDKEIGKWSKAHHTKVSYIAIIEKDSLTNKAEIK